MSNIPLTYDDGPLVWVDCEMTGLDLSRDRIIEIAVIITDGRLNPVDKGIEYVVKTPKAVLDSMGEWCTEQHGKTGLTDACLASPHSHEEVTRIVAEYVSVFIVSQLAGHCDDADFWGLSRFLLKEMPEVMKHLSYRIVDVSSIKEICKRWYPSIRQRERISRTTEPTHRALDDIRASIRELEFYRNNIFLPLEPVPVTRSVETELPHKTAL
ncbi:MAG: hypothetical protein TREMPRED_004946 [Tremellales sp. Tagirdzhanova-0007]|nr:MAG: hypothetical protein TREMPRED_004946 [Tremellales sp. Tagirdzhanova-0007]